MRRIPLASTNGYGTARDLAKLVGILANGGTHNGKSYISARTVKLLTEILTDGGTDKVIKTDKLQYGRGTTPLKTPLVSLSGEGWGARQLCDAVVVLVVSTVAADICPNSPHEARSHNISFKCNISSGREHNVVETKVFFSVFGILMSRCVVFQVGGTQCVCVCECVCVGGGVGAKAHDILARMPMSRRVIFSTKDEQSGCAKGAHRGGAQRGSTEGAHRWGA